MKVNLNDVCKEIFAGGDVPKDKFSEKLTKEYKIPIYANAEKNNGLYGYTDKARVFEPAVTIAARGTIGFCAKRYEPFLPVVRLITAIPNKDKISVEYLYYLLRKLSPKGSGTSIPQLTVPDVKRYSIDLIELEKQKKIVNILDNISNIINLRQRQLKQLDTLIKARFVEMFGDPIENDKCWKQKTLKDVVTSDCSISYGIVQTGDDQENGVPVFRPVDIVGKKPILSELKKTTHEISNKYKRTILTGRELLITVRANIADTYITDAEFTGCNVGRGIVPIRTDENVITLEFLKYQIDNKHLNDYIKSLAKGITLIQLNIEDLRNILLIIPPIDLQNEFAEFVEQVDKSKVVVQNILDKIQHYSIV